MPSAKVLSLFKPANYKFSTHETGRLSSLYYEDATGNQGRWRRQHRNGPLLVYQGKSMRLFIDPGKLAGFEPAQAYPIWHRLADHSPDVAPKLADNPRELLKARLHRQLVAESEEDMAGAYSRSPKQGWHVIEINGTTRQVGHCSGGGVLLQDPTKPGHAAHAALANYTGAEVDWTV